MMVLVKNKGKKRICANKVVGRFLAIIFFLFLCTFSNSVYGQEQFSVWCGVEGTNSYIKQYVREDNYYLFLTNNYNLSNVTISYSGDVLETSNGDLDTENKTISNIDAMSYQAIQLDLDGGTKVTVHFMQSQLPSMSITLNGTSLQTIHQDKNIKYPGNHLSLTDGAAPDYNIDTNDVEIKGRGNSSWIWYDKKSYQIKFDSKTSVLGMNKAKKWVLLANAGDGSLMSNKLAYDLGKQFNMHFSCDTRFIDLWIDGEYLGNYLVSEKIEIDKKRLNLKDSSGILVESDYAFYSDEDYWFQSSVSKNHYACKETVDEDNIQNVVNEFQSFIETLDTHLYSDNVNFEAIESMIDVDSLAQYYTINEFLLNHESFVTSFYLYKDGNSDVLHFGPLWDFDTSMSSSGISPTGSYCINYPTNFSSRLIQDPNIAKRVKELWDNDYSSKVNTMLEEIDQLYSSISTSADMNYTRWDVLGKRHFKGTFEDTYEKNVDLLRNWLTERISQFSPIRAVTESSISNKCLNIQTTVAETSSDIKFYIWSEENGTDDISLIDGTEVQPGVWTCEYPLANKESGKYNIHTSDFSDPLNVKRLAISSIYYDAPARIMTEVSNNEVTIIGKKTSEFSNMYFWVWSEDQGKDDLIRVPGTQDEDGDWKVKLSSSYLRKNGKYIIHMATEIGDTEKRLDEGEFNYTKQQQIDIKFTNQKAVITGLNTSNYDNIWFWIWSEENGYDDLVHVPACKDNDGNWVYEFNLLSTSSSGKFNVHMATMNGDNETRIAEDSFEYTKKPSINTKLNHGYLEITSVDTEGYDNIWYWIWSGNNGYDDLIYVPGIKNSEGNWEYQYKIGDASTYHIHMVTDSDNEEISLKQDDISFDFSPQITTDVEKNVVYIRGIDTDIYDNIWFWIWKDGENYQDLIHVESRKDDDGTCVYCYVGHGEGLYHIHMATETKSGEKRLAEGVFVIQ